MRISVIVKPNSKSRSIIKDKEIDYHYKVRLVSPPTENKANKELISLISDHFRVSKSKVLIEKGLKSRQKILSINL